MTRTPLRHLLRDREDRTLSPYTGWTRDSWAALADDLLLGARAFATPGHGGIRFPGPVGGYGADVDLLEGFARTFLAAGFRVAGENGDDPNGYLDWYAKGIAAGVDPSSDERWVRLDEHHQSKVEAASIALVLHLTKPWLWDKLSPLVQEQVVDYLSPAIGTAYPPNNWYWFQIVVEQFLANVGAEHSRSDIIGALEFTDGFAREDGWYADGEERSFDHYAGWALHFYPHIWLEMAAGDPLAESRRADYTARTARYIEDAARLVGADGSPLLQGRSLAYRFAAAAPFWVAARGGIGSVPAGTLRRAASGILSHFVNAGVPDAAGILTMGWHHPFAPIAQGYSGPGSPYWASKGLLGLSLPATHPVWTAVEEPLPAETEDQEFVVRAPGWLVSSRRADGVVRIVNHGTDHSYPGSERRDSPLYARLGYSTATSPLIAGGGVGSPLDQSVVLLDDKGRATSRTGFIRDGVEKLPSGTLVGASHWRAHWVDPDDDTLDLGFGHSGQVARGPAVEVVSIVRGGWEVRAVRVSETSAQTSPPAPNIASLRVGGWPIPCGGRIITSVILDQSGLSLAGTTTADHATPLAEHTVVPWVATPSTPQPQCWYVCAVGLNDTAMDAAPQVTVDENTAVTIAWADGSTENLQLEHSPSQMKENRAAV